MSTKKILTLAFAVVFSMTAYSQAYVQIGTGYLLQAPNNDIGTEYNSESSGDYTQKNLFGTYGGGIPVNLDAGYMFTDVLFGEIGIGYRLGSMVTNLKDTRDFGTFGTSDVEVTSKSSGLTITPRLGVCGELGDMKVYAKGGLVLPAGGKTVTENMQTYTNSAGDSTHAETWESQGAFSLGFSGALGVVVGISDALNLYVELTSQNLQIKQNTSTMTKYEENGNDRLSTLTKSQTETTYVDQLDQDSNTDATDPAEALAGKTNFNNFGIQVGVSIPLGN